MADQRGCGILGNPDLYGLGIRIGIYLQWAASQIATYFLLEGSADLSDTYFFFNIALMIALIVLTFQDGTYTIEVVVMLYIVFGGMFSVQGYRKGKWRPSWNWRSSWRVVLAFALFTGLGVYGAWFWITGRKSDRYLPTPCGETVFLFAKIPPRHFGRVSSFFAFLSIYFLVGSVGAMAIIVYEMVFKHRRGQASSRGPEEWIAYINESDQPKLATIVRYHNKVSTSSAASAQLEEIDLTHIVVSTDQGINRWRIPIQPKLKTLDQLPKWLEVMYHEADRGDSRITSVMGRLRQSRRRLRRGLNTRSRGTSLRGINRIFSAAALIYSILAVELTLKWNKISNVYDVNSTGQLIPLVVGVGGVLKVFLDIDSMYKERRDGGGEGEGEEERGYEIKEQKSASAQTTGTQSADAGSRQTYTLQTIDENLV